MLVAAAAAEVVAAEAVDEVAGSVVDGVKSVSGKTFNGGLQR